MKKKALLLASMGALGCTVGVTALAVGGANQLDIFPVKATPTEYSVTFNASNTSSEEVDIYGDKHVIFTTTTERGATVGMFGYDIIDGNIGFANYNVWQICLFSNGYIAEKDFDHFTGIKVAFTGSAEFYFMSDNGEEYLLESDVRFSRECVPADRPRIEAMDEHIDITSITIYYTC